MRREREVIKAERKSETERKGGKRRERKKNPDSYVNISGHVLAIW